MKSFFLLLVITFISLNVYTQSAVSIHWEKYFGGTDQDDAYSVQQTTDSGYIIAGITASNDGDVTGNHGGRDYWVVKTDKNGVLQWQKCYGGSSLEEAMSIMQTGDGGFFISGTGRSTDGDITAENSGYWIIKTDPAGSILWQKSFGFPWTCELTSADLTTDGGYIVAGFTYSGDGVPGSHGGADYWVIKVDSEGSVQWEKAYGGSASDAATSVKQTTDGGYIIAGRSESNDGDVSGNHGFEDYWVVKTDSSGEIQWQKSYGGSEDDGSYNDFQMKNYSISPAIQQTSEGGYIIAGSSASNNGDVSGNHGSMDYWVVKTDVTGNIQWQKCYGGSFADYARSIQQTSDGGFIIAGYSRVGVNDLGREHYHIFKTDMAGEVEWDKVFDKIYSVANSVCQTNDGNYIIAGTSQFQFGIIKTCFPDPLAIDISAVNYCTSTTLTATNGFASYLWNTGETTQSILVTNGGAYSVTATNFSGCPSEMQIALPNPVQPFSNEQICVVTLDALTGKNKIIIEPTLNVGTDSVIIYRLNDLTSTFKQIGSLGINEPGIFVDTDAIPAQESYLYKISVRDTCGKESDLSDYHRTIFLQANIGINNEINLNWNPYEGFYYPNFEIYRSTEGGSFFLIANVPNTIYAFTDLTPPAGVKRYQVKVTKGTTCSPYLPISNILKVGIIGIEESPVESVSVYPNPASNYLNVKTSDTFIGADYEITDHEGRTLLQGKLLSQNTEINISGLCSGMYVIHLNEPYDCRFKVIKK